MKYETRKIEFSLTWHFPVNYSRAICRFGAPIDRILYRRLKFFCVVDRSVSRTCHATTFFKFRILWNYFNIISRTLVIYLRSYICTQIMAIFMYLFKPFDVDPIGVLLTRINTAIDKRWDPLILDENQMVLPVSS